MGANDLNTGNFTVDATLDFNEPIMSLDDPMLCKFPFAYLCEIGFMNLTDQEIAGLREYLLRGGFMMFDDFHGFQEFAAFSASGFCALAALAGLLALRRKLAGGGLAGGSR